MCSFNTAAGTNTNNTDLEISHFDTLEEIMKVV